MAIFDTFQKKADRHAVDNPGKGANSQLDKFALDIIENAHICTLLLNWNREVIYLNNAVIDLLGYEQSECLNHSFDNLIVEGQRDDAKSNHADIINGKQKRSVNDWLLIHRDGSHIPVMSTEYALFGGFAQPNVIAVQLIDLSRQKAAEEQLEISEQRSKFALESASQGVWDRNQLTGEVYHSDLWYTMRGFAPGDLEKTLDWRERLHPEDREHALRISAERKQGIFTHEHLEYRERNNHGEWIWISSSGQAIEWGPDNRPTRIVGTDTDVTLIKEAEIALAQLSERLQLALRTSQVGVWELNLKNGEERWDSVMKAMHGCPDVDDDVISKGFWESFVHPEDKAVATLKFEQTEEDLVYSERNFRIIRRDGTIRHIESVARNYKDAYGVRWLLGTDRDVTDEVIAAEELRIAKTLAEFRNTELEIARARMEYNALHDALTDLPNRRYLDETLEKMSRGKVNVTILHLDIDRFKQINDTLGHAAGDTILVHCANVLRENTKSTDFLARVGGDEFVVCINGEHDEKQLITLATRIIARMREPIKYEGHECRFGVSIGIAQRDGRNIDARSILVDADIALYRAKNNGRSCFRFFTEELQQEVVRTKQVADEVLVAIENDQFQPYYQLQFDAETLDIVGAEALVRWNHPSAGLLTPDKFLQVAEGLNVIATIDRLILQKSLADFDTWSAAGLGIPKVSVNVSSKRLRDEELIKHLEEIEFTPGTLSFELLESIFLDDEERLITWNVDSIKDMGIEVVVDDFGTGHASIVGLLKIAPHCLKIDRQLIAPITNSKRERLLAKSIIEIGKSLGIRVVAEGVETMEQVKILRELECDVLQGYLFCKPMASLDLQSFVEDQKWRAVEAKKV